MISPVRPFFFQIAQVPPKLVDKRVVACEGDSNPALGHPKVYINLDSHDPVNAFPDHLTLFIFKSGRFENGLHEF